MCKKIICQKSDSGLDIKNCAEEFKPYPIDYIMDECIEGVPDIATKAVHQDHLDIVQGEDRKIQGLNVEDTSIRGIYYCCRMISAQYGTVFHESEFGKIRKVYSIWVCPIPSKRRSNTIQKYSMAEKNILGDVKEDVDNYDLLTVIFLRLGEDGENSGNELIRLLSVLLSSKVAPADKKRILNDDF